MKETWKSVMGWEGYFWVSDRGRVKSRFDYLKSSPNKNRHGYNYVNLLVLSTRKNVLLHRLVAINFIPNPENKPCVNHKDFNVSNNAVENLEWVTHKENSEHNVRHGRTPHPYGELAGNAKHTIKTVRKIRKDLLKGMSNADVARKYKTAQANVAHIKRGSRWGNVK